MAELSESPIAHERTQLERAAPVIERAQILSVLLAESQAKRTPDADLKAQGLTTDIQISNVEVGSNRDSKQIFVMPSFALNITKKGDEDAGPVPVLSVEAKFVLIYSVDTFDGLNDENIGSFGVTNGVFNAWPYWREFVQNTVTRMGLQGLIIPLFRVPSSIASQATE